MPSRAKKESTSTFPLASKVSPCTVTPSRPKRLHGGSTSPSHAAGFIGLSLYLLCLSLPSLLEALSAAWHGHPAPGTAAASFGHFRRYLDHFAPLLSWRQYKSDLWTRLCATSSSSSSSEASKLPSYVFSVLCADGASDSHGDTTRSDIFFVGVLSTLLAVARVAIVAAVVPRYLAPRRLAAMVREKSSHMLSSRAYAFEEFRFGRNRNSQNRVPQELAEETTTPQLLQPPPSPPARDVRAADDDEDSDFGYGEGYWIDLPSESEDASEAIASHHGLHRRSLREVGAASPVAVRSLTPQPVSRRHSAYDPHVRPGSGETAAQEPDAPKNLPRRRASRSPSTVRENVRRLVKEGGGVDDILRIWYKIRSSLHRSLGHEPVAPHYANLNAAETLRLFSAPRQATALFRLIFCVSSSFSALNLFRHAAYWPPPLGGTGRTRACWDLSGGISGALDNDYDHLNSALRYYFLCQVAYHLHSLTFQVLSTFLMFVYGGDGKFVSMRSGLKGYVRPLVEHLLGVIGMVWTFFFASWRRLGTLGMFAFDFSSIFLYLLQVSINAPADSWLSTPRIVRGIHRYLAVPSFVYCRFFVFPFIVWRSAFYESEDWLHQIEKAFFPGAANVLSVIFNTFHGLVLVSNIIFFNRLLRHPQVAALLDTEKDKVPSPPTRRSSM